MVSVPAADMTDECSDGWEGKEELYWNMTLFFGFLEGACVCRKRDKLLLLLLRGATRQGRPWWRCRLCWRRRWIVAGVDPLLACHMAKEIEETAVKGRLPAA